MRCCLAEWKDMLNTKLNSCCCNFPVDNKQVSFLFDHVERQGYIQICPVENVWYNCDFLKEIAHQKNIEFISSFYVLFFLPLARMDKLFMSLYLLGSKKDYCLAVRSQACCGLSLIPSPSVSSETFVLPPANIRTGLILATITSQATSAGVEAPRRLPASFC